MTWAARLALLAVACVAPISGAQPGARPPNIVVIFADDLGYADIAPFFAGDPARRPLTPSLDNFVVGRNAEALAALRAVAAGQGEPFVYLWGEAGSGRSHSVSW